MTGARAGAMTRHVESESCPWPPVGNRVDPLASADAMKARFAEMEREVSDSKRRVADDGVAIRLQRTGNH
jgi:hypothetical protein